MLHLLVGIAFLCVLVSFADPFMLYMPSDAEYMTAAILAVLAAIFVGLVFREHARDEREVGLRAHSARWGYIAGVSTLTLAVVVSVATGAHPDPWILGALAVMILARLVSRAAVE
jgi:hypothetical protein